MLKPNKPFLLTPEILDYLKENEHKTLLQWRPGGTFWDAVPTPIMISLKASQGIYMLMPPAPKKSAIIQKEFERNA